MSQRSSQGFGWRHALLLAGLAGSVAGCDRGGAAGGQAAPANASSSAPSPDEAAPAAASSAAPVAGAVDRSHAGEAAPTATFTDADGKPVSLAKYSGKPVVVNLWATWCAPCIKELPSLAAAAKASGATVLAISQDMDEGKAKAFLTQHPIAPVVPAFDPKLGFSLALGANLPTTIAYDAAGKERWRVTGGRDWQSAESQALLTSG